MKRLLALSLFLLGSITAAHATVANVNADAHVTSTLPSTNFGGRSNLAVNSTSTAYLRFDLSNLPGGTTSSQVSKAVLYVYVNRVYSSGTLSLAGLSSAFTESSVTYNTKPAAGTASATGTVSAAGSFVAFDVTSLVQGWVTTSSSNYGVALTTSSTDVLMDSKENDLTGHAAYIDVTLVNQGATGPAGPTGATGPAGVNGTNGTNGTNGAQGAQGPAGPTGATGTIGTVVNYAASTSYPVGQVVYCPTSGACPSAQQGSSYISILATTGTQNPSNTTYWQQITSVGATGAAGPTGAAGTNGANGPQGPTGPGFSNGSAAGQIYLTGSSPYAPQAPQTVTGAIAISSTGVTTLGSAVVNSGNIANNAVTGSAIASGAITNSKISANAVTGGSSGSLATSTITAANLATTGTASSSTYLSSDGSGNLTWATPSGGSSNTGSTLTTIPYTVLSHGQTASTQVFFSPMGSGTGLTTSATEGAVTLVPTSCHALLTIYSPGNNVTWNLESASYSGGTTPSSFNSLGNCSTSSSVSKCSIDGGTVNAGSLLTIYNGGNSNLLTFETAFSCQ